MCRNGAFKITSGLNRNNMRTQIQADPICNRSRPDDGWTLVEMIVALAAGSVILAAILSTALFVSKSFIAMGNYTDLDRESRHALDTMSRDIRNAAGMSAYATNSITLTNRDGSQFTYAYSSNTTLLTRVNSSGTTVLLTNCNILTFHIYQRNPTNNFQFTPATAVSQAKLVDVSWRCSRNILGAIINSESVQTAKIVIRN